MQCGMRCVAMQERSIGVAMQERLAFRRRSDARAMRERACAATMEHTAHLIGLHDDAIGLPAQLAAPLEGTQRFGHRLLVG
jgi:hypothetical protein